MVVYRVVVYQFIEKMFAPHRNRSGCVSVALCVGACGCVCCVVGVAQQSEYVQPVIISNQKGGEWRGRRVLAGRVLRVY